MQERNSEHRIAWVVIALIGCQLLGIDIGQLIGHVQDAKTQLDAAQGALGDGTGSLALAAISGLYTWGRIKLKHSREQQSKEKNE